jgi:large subunit ribosomal protein L35Ae
MKAIIMNFRGSRRKQETSNQVIVHVDGLKNREAAKSLVNRKINWNTPKGKAISGKITAVHGNNSVRAVFEKGLPGQALGTEIKLE